MTSFGQALYHELAGTNVSCTTALVGYTRTGHFERNQLGTLADGDVADFIL